MWLCDGVAMQSLEAEKQGKFISETSCWTLMAKPCCCWNGNIGQLPTGDSQPESCNIVPGHIGIGMLSNRRLAASSLHGMDGVRYSTSNSRHNLITLTAFGSLSSPHIGEDGLTTIKGFSQQHGMVVSKWEMHTSNDWAYRIGWRLTEHHNSRAFLIVYKWPKLANRMFQRPLGDNVFSWLRVSLNMSGWKKY